MSGSYNLSHNLIHRVFDLSEEVCAQLLEICDNALVKFTSKLRLRLELFEYFQ